MESIAGLLPLILIIVVFYFLIIRPTRNRQREALRLQQQLAPGQQVMTGSGLYATVVGLDEESVTLETGPGVRSRWARGAVARIITPEPAAADRDDSGDTGDPRDGAPGGPAAG